MNYPAIRIEGGILSPDLLDRLDDVAGQRPADFGFDSSVKVKDEIARAWADAQDYWRIFQRKLEGLKPDAVATTETRQQWIGPLFSLLGYQIEFQRESAVIGEKNYPISHRITNRADTATHITGYRDPAGLDRKPERTAGPRMSAHALVQEFLNLSDQLYGIVTNGRVLRLLRDSSRLVKLTYLEFDLDRIFTDGLFADFAVLYRLLHVTRLPVSQEAAAESLIERYHQDSVDSGARIRDGLSRAVEEAIRAFANGLLNHPNSQNDVLRSAVTSGELMPKAFYQHLLRLIYRLLFLLVIEERNLVYPLSPSATKRDLYYRFYSLQRLRRLAEKRYLADPRKEDLWLALIACFRLFEADGPGVKLGIAPLAGDLFSPNAIGLISGCRLDNATVLSCLRSLSLYQNPDTNQLIRVNYAALNVEELGSVYEGLLKFEPTIDTASSKLIFELRPSGDDTQSHYTPDDLVQPLLKNSLDYLIADKLKEPDKEKALLSLRVADISCGSGHILLAAARRIATELAIVRTGEEQPSPAAFRAAIRDVIRECIYGVDLNPLAVELCKVAMWLEAHSPGEPLNFLDHHIKCGNAIVGFARRDELERGVPDEAFATMPGDDKEVAAALRKRNKAERTEKAQQKLALAPEVQKHLDAILARWREVSRLPEHDPAEIETKKRRFIEFSKGQDAWLLGQIASIPIAQFYLPKTLATRPQIITDDEFRACLGGRHPQGQGTAAAWATAVRKKFFHWFLEFPEIIQLGGFDCILGNPPYLGRGSIRQTYGDPFCEYVQWEFAPAGISDLVAFFVRRIYSLLRSGGFASIITTNSIRDGDVRKDGIDQVVAGGGVINFAVRGIKWPGRANLFVSLLGLHRGVWDRPCFLDGKRVPFINTYFEGSKDAGDPKVLRESKGRIIQGAIFRGDGFVISHEEADTLCANDERNREVVFPIINGQEMNHSPEQKPGRSIINFFDWPIERAQVYQLPFLHLEEFVKADRTALGEAGKWWQFWRPRMELNSKLKSLKRCFSASRTTKYLNFSACPIEWVFSDAIYVFATDRWDLYAVVQSTIHEVWARKYSGALETRLRYSPSDCFETFPFPEGQWQISNNKLAAIGERYHEHRRHTMPQLWLGLTDIYNLFHTRDLSPAIVAKVSGKSVSEAESGYRAIIQLRDLHRELDQTLLTAYGWSDLDLGHDFQEVETLPENDRVRYTISPAARKELLERLLAENHRRAQLTIATSPAVKKSSKRKKAVEHTTDDLFATITASPKPESVPAPAWMDRPLVMPSVQRVALDSSRYRSALVPHLLYQAGGRVSFDRFRRAYWLLTEPKLLQRFTRAELGAIAQQWGQSFCDKLKKDEFLPHLKGAVIRQLHFIRVDGERWLELRDTSVVDDPHIIFDARISLLAADLWPNNEPIAPLTQAEEQILKELELV
jgi:hypothetical protein